ncbi:interferon-induced, double-stranded RNA-activated protein kinase-like isoform X2 [Alosa sapidissima]|uniref:interferon-induced, double-stranded RNA-activated protein kinase-like isoform X2 n=1 Tax=Alosa sapidissima TaxID=34773 RepID=UPI001C081064|nr:interferon-induced, double-stranded RNA-activated protein kinase-like isoform X2 [Alosa sapidissima]
MNYVAKLNEYGQKNHVNVQYEEKATPDHTKAFTVRAIVNGKRYPEGVGKNKREAKENAALKALGMLPHKESNGFSSSPAKIVQPNYQCWLNEHSQKTGVTYKPIERTRVGAASTPFCCQYVSTNGESYPEGYGESKQKAKEEAAKLAYLALRVTVCYGVWQDQKRASSVESTLKASAAGGKHRRSAPTPATVFSHTSNAGGKELNFFNKHKAELETRLSTTSVLIQLEGCGILNAVERETVEAERISVSQNHALIVMLSRKGERAQEKFYEILKETDPYLVKDLEKGVCTS